MSTLSRKELTAALAARQLLLERVRLSPARAVAHLTPLQGQEPMAPFIALAARLEGFARADLEAAIERREVVKTTIMRLTLHLAAGADYPAFAQLARQPHLRAWRKRYAHLDEERVVADLGAWLREPRTNAEIRERVGRLEGVPDEPYAPIFFARTVLPLVQPAPAGFWGARRRPTFVVDPRPLPSPEDAAEHVLRRYLAAFGPASRRDAATWAGVAQRDLAPGWERIGTVAFRDERGTELHDLPGAPLPPGSTTIPVRFLSRWEQVLLAHDDRSRVLPDELLGLRLTLSGDQTVLVDGRVAASWKLERTKRVARVVVEPHAAIPRRALAGLRAEARRTAAFCHPEAATVEVAGV